MGEVPGLGVRGQPLGTGCSLSLSLRPVLSFITLDLDAARILVVRHASTGVEASAGIQRSVDSETLIARLRTA